MEKIQVKEFKCPICNNQFIINDDKIMVLKSTKKCVKCKKESDKIRNGHCEECRMIYGKGTN